MKALIIAAHFPPELNIASFRPYFIAKGLTDAGWDVHIVTNDIPDADHKLELDISKFTIIKIQNKLQMYFRKSILVKGKAESSILSLQKSSGILSNLKLWAIKISRYYGVFNGQRFPDFYNIWIYFALKKISLEYDVLITTSPPYALSYLGLLIKRKKNNIYWVCDWRDLWTKHPIYPGFPVIRFFEKKLEKLIMNEANLNVYASTGMEKSAKKISEYQNSIVMYNGYDSEFSRYVNKTTDTIIQIVYTGTIYPKIRDPESLFSLLSNIKREYPILSDLLKFVFVGSGDSVTQLAKHYEISDLVEVRGLVSHSESRKMQVESSYLLYLDCDLQEEAGVIGAKLFEYISVGVPILCINSPVNGEASEIIKNSGMGLVFNKQDSDLLKRFILNLIKSEKRHDFVPNVTFISEFKRAHQIDKLIKKLPYE